MSTVYNILPGRSENFTRDQIIKIRGIHPGLGEQLAAAAFTGCGSQPKPDTPRKIPDDGLYIVNTDAPSVSGNARMLRDALSGLTGEAVPFTYKQVKVLASDLGLSSGSPAYLVREGHLLEQTSGE